MRLVNLERIKSRGVLFTYKPSDEWDLNIYLIMGSKYNYIVDTGLGSLSIAPVRDFLRDSTKAVLVINTHHHWDHIWGNGSLKESAVIAHKRCKELMEAKWQDMLNKNVQYCDGSVEMRLPDMIFDNELYFPEDKVRIIYTPGHTIDSVSVLDEEDKVLHVGDNIGDSLDEILPSLYCEENLYKETLFKYQALDFDTCLSGHNVVLGKEIIGEILNKMGQSYPIMG